MIKFKEILESQAFQKKLEFPSTEVVSQGHKLSIRFSSKDEVVDCAYEGNLSPWLGALCAVIIGKNLSQITSLNWSHFETSFKDDQMFWDFREEETSFLDKHFEMLHAAIEIYRGREYLFKEESPLVCRCFGIREKDILAYLQKEASPTFDTLAVDSKAGMGCRSCVPQLKRWLLMHEGKNVGRFYKEKAIADWLLDIDYMLSCFPKAAPWKMEVQSFKNNQVIISFDKTASQKEEEETTKELQEFLGASVDSDLGFFLRRARHF